MGRAPKEVGASHRESAGEGHESKQNVNQHHHTPKQPTMEEDNKRLNWCRYLIKPVGINVFS